MRRVVCRMLLSGGFVVLGLFCSGVVTADPVHFSRANCGNNESISWDWVWKEAHYWSVVSTQYGFLQGNMKTEVFRSGEVYGHRAAAISWLGAYNDGGVTWFVFGDHYEKYPGTSNYILIRQTSAKDCGPGIQGTFPEIF